MHFLKIDVPCKTLEKLNKIQRVKVIESSVFEIQERFQIRFGMVQHELVGSIIHHLQQLQAFADDGFSLAPSKRRRKKTGNFNVLLDRKPMRDRNRVQRYEIRLIVERHFLIQKFF